MTDRDRFIDDIRRDVSSFADPGTEVSIEQASGVMQWRRGGRDWNARLLRSGGEPAIEFAGLKLPVASFLASEGLADLRQLAEAMQATVRVPTMYVEGRVRQEGPDSVPAGASSALRSLSVEDLPLTYVTRVVFIHGNAGAGKTSLLSHLVREQADRYLNGEVHCLYLYLDAQGKGLTQLEDVMARALQDLRARFTYHSVAALTRRRAIVPIIDGFDELIGPSSAREAFANLSLFLAQLDKEGVVLASSRSAFIDYRTLHERASEIAAAKGLAYEILPVEVLNWDRAEVEEYVKRRDPESPTLAREVSRLFDLPEGTLLRKPFFLEQVCRLHLEGRPIRGEAGADLPRQIVEASLARESEKLKDPRGNQILTPTQHHQWCELLAEEMWYQGTSELDNDTVRLIATMLGEDLGLDERALKMFVDRAPAHGLLVQAGGDSEKRRFEHELFRFEFQAGRFVRALVEGEERLADLLERTEVPIEILERVSRARLWTGEQIAGHVLTLSGLAESRSRNVFMGSNAGAFVGVLIKDRTDIPAGLRLSRMTLRGSTLGHVRLQGASVAGCLFERVDLSNAEWLSCVLHDTRFVVCRLGDASKWGGTKVDPGDFLGMLVGQSETYDPTRIVARLQKCGAVLPPQEFKTESADAQKTEERFQLVEAVLQHSRSHFYIDDEEDPWVKRTVSRRPREWKRLVALLKKHGLLTEGRFDKSGPPRTFLKFVASPDMILQSRVSGAEPAGAFWRELQEGSGFD